MSANLNRFFAMTMLSAAMACAPLAARGATLTPMQQTANKLQSDLEQALSESNFNALQRAALEQDATTLVAAANEHAAGHRPKRKPVKKAEKDLQNAFASGLLQVDDAAQLNLDLADFKDAGKKKKK